jgi:EAL domain-containing protein (putative c-di-GMP-specific phosphodiesterase class I)
MSSFKSTVSKKDMQLRFQPIVDLRHRQAHHYEVLVRFEGDKSPYELIKFAESVHLVHEMDLAICESVIDWLERGAERCRPVTLAVNLSAQSLQNAIFVQRLLDLLRRHPQHARRLIFEITESTELQDLAAANAVIQQLRQRGHEMCLDDFGADFASFQYLHGLHVDYVKLDGKYIRPVLDSPRDRVMLKAMVGLCGDLGIRTVAEMIETETQAGLLAEIGVEFGQGWLFGRPAPAPELPVAAAAPPARVSIAGRRRGVQESWG